MVNSAIATVRNEKALESRCISSPIDINGSGIAGCAAGDLHCRTLLDPGTEHTPLVFTAVPRSPSQDAPQLLAVIGHTTSAR